MSLYSQFETDASLEKNGIVLEYPGNVRIRIARAGGANTKYLKALEAKVKPHRRLIQNDLMRTEDQENLVLDVFCDTVVLGWENVTDREGNDLPFTPDNARKLFKDLPDLYKDVQEQAQRSVLFRKEIREEDAKN